LILVIARQATADYGLPPRGTQPESGAAPVSVITVGARLQLQTQFSQSWPWETMPWYEVWTVVQWSDGKGGWFDVAGWQGSLDSVSQVETDWVGNKEWWVAAEDLGTGPFRWLIYQYPGGPLLEMSDPFYLPAIANQVGIVQQELTP
jgi:hypothetical protein